MTESSSRKCIQELEINCLRYKSLLLRLDNFLKIHINLILGSSNIIEGKKKLDSQSTISNKSLIFELNLHSNIINEYSEHLSLVSDIMNDNDKIVKN